MTRTFIRSAAALVAVPLIVLSLGACSGPAPAGGASADGTLKTTGKDWDVAKDKCLREAGFDIKQMGGEGSGVVGVDGGNGGNFETADKKCTKQVDQKLGKRPVSHAEKKRLQKDREAAEKTTDCLRKAGYDVPDVDDNSGSTAGMKDIPENALAKCGAGSGPATNLEQK